MTTRREHDGARVELSDVPRAGAVTLPASVSLVTGGASGLGRALAQALAARGGRVVIVDRSPDVHRAARELSAGGSAPVSAIELDIRDGPAIGGAVAAVLAEHGHLDLLVNNAGVMRPGDALDLTAEAWDEVFDTNVRGTVNTIRACYPAMVARRNGQILNIASISGLVPGPLNTPYATSKHAVVGLSLSLRAEAAAYGVRVSVACPSAVGTPLLQAHDPPSGRMDESPMPALWKRRAAWLTMGLPGRSATCESTVEQILAGLLRDAAVIPTGHARTAWRIARVSPDATGWGARLQARSQR